MSFGEVVHSTGTVLEAVGMALISVGTVVALARYVFERTDPEAYRTLRRRIGRVMLVGLEVLVAGDIVRTVAVELTYRSVGLLASIVLIRTFLSMVIEVEIGGALPWRRAGERTPSG